MNSKPQHKEVGLMEGDFSRYAACFGNEFPPLFNLPKPREVAARAKEIANALGVGRRGVGRQKDMEVVDK